MSRVTHVVPSFDAWSCQSLGSRSDWSLADVTEYPVSRCAVTKAYATKRSVTVAPAPPFDPQNHFVLMSSSKTFSAPSDIERMVQSGVAVTVPDLTRFGCPITGPG